jgi:hypothetical protein
VGAKRLGTVLRLHRLPNALVGSSTRHKPSCNATKQQFRNELDLSFAGLLQHFEFPSRHPPAFLFCYTALAFPLSSKSHPSIQRAIPKAKYKLPGLKTLAYQKQMEPRVGTVYVSRASTKPFAAFSKPSARKLADTQNIFLAVAFFRSAGNPHENRGFSRLRGGSAASRIRQARQRGTEKRFYW